MRIKKIFLETTKIEELNFFYQETIGLIVSHFQKDELIVHSGISEIVFRKHKGNHQPFYHFAFNIPYNKIEAARECLKEKIKLIWIEDYNGEIAEFVNWKARSIYFFDPAGNIVELIGRKEFCLDGKNGFGANDFLSVSEIGLVFSKEDYDKKIWEIIKWMELDFFSRQKPVPGFSAIGNDEGLLIAVYSDRNWYPTNKRSGIFPLEIEILSQEKLFMKQIS